MQINQLSQLLNSSGVSSLTNPDSSNQSTDASASFEKILEEMLMNMAAQTADNTSTLSTANTTGAINAVSGAKSSAANSLDSLQLQSQNIAQMLQALSSQSLMQSSTLGSTTSDSDSEVNASDSSAIL